MGKLGNIGFEHKESHCNSHDYREGGDKESKKSSIHKNDYKSIFFLGSLKVEK